MKLRYWSLVLIGLMYMWYLGGQANEEAIAACMVHHSQDTCYGALMR